MREFAVQYAYEHEHMDLSGRYGRGVCGCSGVVAGSAAGRRAQFQTDALRQDMQTLVAAQSQALGAQLIQLSQTVGQLSQTMVAQTGQVLQQVAIRDGVYRNAGEQCAEGNVGAAAGVHRNAGWDSPTVGRGTAIGQSIVEAARQIERRAGFGENTWNARRSCAGADADRLPATRFLRDAVPICERRGCGCGGAAGQKVVAD